MASASSSNFSSGMRSVTHASARLLYQWLSNFYHNLKPYLRFEYFYYVRPGLEVQGTQEGYLYPLYATTFKALAKSHQSTVLSLQGLSETLSSKQVHPLTLNDKPLTLTFNPIPVTLSSQALDSKMKPYATRIQKRIHAPAARLGLRIQGLGLRV